MMMMLELHRVGIEYQLHPVSCSELQFFLCCAITRSHYSIVKSKRGSKWKRKESSFFLQFVNYCSLARQLYPNCVERKEQLEGLHRQWDDDDLAVGMERKKTQKNFAHCFFYDSRSLKLHISSSYTTSTTSKTDDDTNWRNGTLIRRAVMWSNIQILILPGRYLISSFFPINFISWKLMYRNWYTPKSSSSREPLEKRTQNQTCI